VNQEQKKFIPISIRQRKLIDEIISKGLSLSKKTMLLNRLILLMFFVVSTLFSQVGTGKKTPKVGLVLSGGGAKGFAHIGVLKVIEKSGIKLDYIGGTSMGAVVGGLYASGYSSSEIDAVIKGIDFSRFLQDKYFRKQFSFFRKNYGEKTLLSFPIYNNKLQLPKAIAVGQNVYNGLNSLFEHVNHINKFDELPIPFFCIGTDIESGKSKVFDEGYLPAAIRASASLPTLLDPMEINDSAYIDGGISDNFPVEEMKRKGVDILIGVNVQGKLEKKEDINSVVDVLNQIVNYQMYGRDDEKLKIVSIHVEPKVKEYSVTSFDKAGEIIDLGEESAELFKEEFEEIAKLQLSVEKQSFTNHIKGKVKVSHISMNNLENYSRAYILGKLKLHVGDSITYTGLNYKIGGLASTGDFKLIEYKFKNGTPSRKELHLKLRENKTSSFLKFGLHYDPLYKSSLLVNYTKKHLFQKNDILSSDFVFGDNLRAYLNYFVDNGFYTSYGFSSRFHKFDTQVKYDEGEVTRINKNYLDVTNFAYVQTVFNKKMAIGLGLEHKYLELYTDALGDETKFFEKSYYLSSLGYVKLDTYDKKYMPKTGFLVDGEFKWYMNSPNSLIGFSQFSQVKLKLATAQTVFKVITAHLVTEGGATIGDNITEQFRYSLGGYGENLINNHIPFYGYDFEELENDSYLKTSLELRYEFIKKNSIGFIGNFARTDLDIYNGGQVFQDVKSGYAIKYVYNSVLGPVSVVNSWSPDRNSKNWYFSLGFWF
jgi:NTE family protein